MEGDNSYTVKDIPGASQLYKKSSISKEAFDKLIHNLVIGITEKSLQRLLSIYLLPTHTSGF